MCFGFHLTKNIFTDFTHETVYGRLSIHMSDPTKERDVTEKNRCTPRQAVKPNYNSSRTCTHTNTHLSLICRQTFVQCHINFHLHIEYSLCITPVACSHDLMAGAPYQGYLTEWATEEDAATEKEGTGSETGRSSDSELQYRKLGDHMHIHKPHFHLSCETKRGYVRRKYI